MRANLYNLFNLGACTRIAGALRLGTVPAITIALLTGLVFIPSAEGQDEGTSDLSTGSWIPWGAPIDYAPSMNAPGNSNQLLSTALQLQVHKSPRW